MGELSGQSFWGLRSRRTPLPRRVLPLPTRWRRVFLSISHAQCRPSGKFGNTIIKVIVSVHGMNGEWRYYCVLRRSAALPRSLGRVPGDFTALWSLPGVICDCPPFGLMPRERVTGSLTRRIANSLDDLLKNARNRRNQSGTNECRRAFWRIFRLFFRRMTCFFSGFWKIPTNDLENHQSSDE